MDEARQLALQLPREGLLAGYQPPGGVFDEMLAPGGLLRQPWDRFVDGLGKLGTAGLAQRTEQVRRILRENGVTYSAVGAPQGPDRPWELDPLPLLFEKRAWQELADALVQRATLLNLILADLYGPQWLLHEGVLPPAVVFDHPGYLLPCRGIRLPENIFLGLYAAHLARQPDGHWLVLTDRTQGPSGTGYTVENRIAVSRHAAARFQGAAHRTIGAVFHHAARTLVVACAAASR